MNINHTFFVISFLVIIANIKGQEIHKTIDSVFHQGDIILCPEIRYSFKLNLQIEDLPSELIEIAEFLQRYPTLIFELRCHTDTRGSKKANLELSEKRAVAIKNDLISQFGIVEKQVVSKGYGETVPIYEEVVIEKCQLINKLNFILKTIELN